MFAHNCPRCGQFVSEEMIKIREARRHEKIKQSIKERGIKGGRKLTYNYERIKLAWTENPEKEIHEIAQMTGSSYGAARKARLMMEVIKK